MAITIRIPSGVEERLRKQDPQLDEKARDMFLVANYQAGRLSTGDIAIILGFDTRYEAEQWLAKQGASQNYSLSDLAADQTTLDRLLGPVQH